MTNKKILVGLVFLLILAATGIVYGYKNYHYAVEVITSEQGWGYNILYNNKLIIHQPYIPSVSGQIAFGDKSSARKTGQLMVKKLKNKQSPAITRAELDYILSASK
jgi:hypothetical protein